MYVFVYVSSKLLILLGEREFRFVLLVKGLIAIQLPWSKEQNRQTDTHSDLLEDQPFNGSTFLHTGHAISP